MKKKTIFSGIINGILIGSIVVVASTLSAETQANNKAAIDNAITSFNHEEANCLALNIYYEARSSNLADKAAVADVVLNRTMDRRYPPTVCGVVQDGYTPGRRDCQFSWYCDGLSDKPTEYIPWRVSLVIARAMLKKKG